MIKVLISLLPVFIFLIVLIYLDSYKLVKITNVLTAILIGFAASIISYFINKSLINILPVTLTTYARYISPVIEESLKAVFIIYLLSKKKIGFMIDAVIYGFAIGAGFAFVENIYYLSVVESSNIFLWIIRGFGTAVMHGGTAAIFSLLTKNLIDRSDKYKTLQGSRFLIYLPGLMAAIVIHSLFNHLLLPAIFITILQLILLPLLIIFIFYKSEQSLRDWMETGLDNDVQLLEQIDDGVFTESHAGQYLLSLQNKFEGPVLVDMLCLIKIHVELSIKAKGVLMMRKANLPVIFHDDVKEKFDELKYLEKNIGSVGKLAVAPIFQFSTRDLWQLYFLGLK
jgi:protease PrsW